MSEPDPTVPEPRRRDVRWLTRFCVAAGIVAVLMAQVSIFTTVRSKDDQIQVLRDQRAETQHRADDLRTETRTVTDRAAKERITQQALVCDEFDKLGQFSAAIAVLIDADTNLTDAQRQSIVPFITPTPRPVECPPTQAKP